MVSDEMRDLFAGLALTALIKVYKDDRSGGMLERIAESAYDYADAMLKARDKGAE